jgi:hypothetical protein
MPIGKRKWFRPISELKGGEGFQNAPQEAQAQEAPQEHPTQSDIPEAPAPSAPSAPSAHPTPPAPAPAFPYTQEEMDGGNLDILSAVIQTLNTNPYFIGVLMLLLNLGGRFISMELTQKQEEFLQQRWLRPIIFFTVIFIATRNLAVAFWMTLGLFLVLWILANEQSPFCMIPSWRQTGLDPAQKEAQYEKNMNIIQSIHEANKV